MEIPGKGKSRLPTTQPNSPPVSTVVSSAATWLSTEPLFTFRLSDGPVESVKTPQIPRIGQATLYKRGFLQRVSYAKRTTDPILFQRVGFKWRLTTRLLGLPLEWSTSCRMKGRYPDICFSQGPPWSASRAQSPRPHSRVFDTSSGPWGSEDRSRACPKSTPVAAPRIPSTGREGPWWRGSARRPTAPVLSEPSRIPPGRTTRGDDGPWLVYIQFSKGCPGTRVGMISLARRRGGGRRVRESV